MAAMSLEEAEENLKPIAQRVGFKAMMFKAVDHITIASITIWERGKAMERFTLVPSVRKVVEVAAIPCSCKFKVSQVNFVTPMPSTVTGSLMVTRFRVRRSCECSVSRTIVGEILLCASSTVNRRNVYAGSL